MKLSLSIRVIFILIFSILQDTTCFRQMKVKHIINFIIKSGGNVQNFWKCWSYSRDKNQLILKLTDRDVHLLNVLMSDSQHFIHVAHPVCGCFGYYKLDNGFRNGFCQNGKCYWKKMEPPVKHEENNPKYGNSSINKENMSI